MAILSASTLSLACGILGNVIGVLFYLSPIPTFHTIYKKKSSDGYQAMPYIVPLTSAMLLLYYGLIKTNGLMLICINALGCVFEVTYVVLFVFYASKQEKMASLKLILLFNVGFLLIFSTTMFLIKEQHRVYVVGWICACFSIAVYASPLSIVAKVIRTKSVEFLPISLLILLVLSAITWFIYGLLVGDMFIAVPNVVGFFLGIGQIILYMIYKDKKPNNDEAKEKQMKNVKPNPRRIMPEPIGIIILVEKPVGPKESNAVDIESGPERSE